MLGIDVSVSQKGMPWNRYAQTDVSFAFIRASQGKMPSYQRPFTDSQFINHMRGAVALGVPFGVYHLLTARNAQEAESEAKYFLSVIEPYREDIALWAVCDVEDEVFLPKDKASLTEVVLRFCDVVRAGGFRPMIYTNPNYLTYRLYSNRISSIPLWLAYWGVSEAAAKRYDPVIWQPGKKKIFGIWTDVDYGYFTPPDVKPSPQKLKAGDRVKVLRPLIYGTQKKFTAYFPEYDVISVSGDRVVIGIGRAVTAAVDAANLEKA